MIPATEPYIDLQRIGFSDAFHAALSAYAGDDPYPFEDTYEYDFLDDFTRKTSRVRCVSVRFGSDTALLPAVKGMMAALLRAEICQERIFYRIEDTDGAGVTEVKMWGMKELAPESELQEAS